MRKKIKILPYLQSATNGRAVVEVEGNTVSRCIDDLIRQFPGLRATLYNSSGELFDFIDIYVNGKSNYHKGLDVAVQDGDELLILLIIEGG